MNRRDEYIFDWEYVLLGIEHCLIMYVTRGPAAFPGCICDALASVHFRCAKFRQAECYL